MARQISRVGVVGLGTMGAGIAEVLARSGMEVVGVEVAPAALARGRAQVERSTDRAVSRGKLTAAERAAVLDRLAFHTDLAGLRDAELVIEAVPERLEVKRELFAELDRICAAQTILATNTSSLPVIDVAMATGRPEQVLGMHWFNPAPVMRLVEVVGTVRTDPAALDDVAALAAGAGKTVVRVGDRPGFIANALLFGYLNAAAAMYASGHASREDIDAAMTAGVGFPMGPLALLDLIGLDTADEILQTIYGATRDRLHAPAPVLRHLVTAGLLGRKTGRGFYPYDGDGGAAAGMAAARPVTRVGVLGTGPPAGAVAAELAEAGYDVRTVDPTADFAPLADRELVIAPTDDLTGQLARLDGTLGPATVVAVGVPPGGSVAALAAGTGRAADVVGLRWRDTRLVEVAASVASAPAAVAAVRAVCEKAGRTVVCCGDRPGLVLDALLYPHLNEAVRMLESGYASAADIDTAMRSGCGYPAGPFELLDDLGPDVALATLTALHRATPEPGLAPAPLLEQMVLLGRRFSAGPGE